MTTEELENKLLIEKEVKKIMKHFEHRYLNEDQESVRHRLLNYLERTYLLISKLFFFGII